MPCVKSNNGLPENRSMAPLTPGSKVTIVVEKDRGDEDPVSLDSTVYEADGETLVLARTSPPINALAAKGKITVTYVAQTGEKTLRLGFPVTFARLIDDYKTAEGVPAPAFAVARKGEPVPFSARRYVRVAPTGQTRLDLYVGGSKVRIADVSLGGVRFTYDVALPLVPDLPVDLRFDLGGEDYAVRSRILRITYDKGRFRTAVAAFTNVTGRFEQALVRTLHAIQRAILKKE